MIYNSFFNTFTGQVNFATDTFVAILVQPGYVPRKGHTRSNIPAVEGYDPAFTAVDVKSGVITFGPVRWENATITAIGVVYAKTAGELIAYAPFDGPVSSTNGDFTVSESSIKVEA